MAKMKNPNGYGCVKKLSGNRRKPWALYVTTGYELSSPVPKIDDLREFLSEETFHIVSEEIEAARQRQTPVGRQVQKAVGYYATRQEALIAQAEYNKNPYDLDRANATFEDIYKMVYTDTISKMGNGQPYTVAHDKCKDLFNLRFRDIRYADLQRVVDQYKHQAKGTQANINTLLHMMYAHAIRNDITDKDYSEFLEITSEKETKEKTPFTREEVQHAWDLIDWMQKSSKGTSLDGVCLADTVVMLIYTGMRINELLTLKKENVHLEDRWIDLRGSKTKAARRIVPIHKKIIPLIEKRMQVPGEYLILNSKGKMISNGTYFLSFWDKYIEANFVVQHTTHDCRHTFASLSGATKGINPILRKKIMGHKTLDITDDIYTHAYIEDLIREMDLYDM